MKVINSLPRKILSGQEPNKILKRHPEILFVFVFLVFLFQKGLYYLCKLLCIFTESIYVPVYVFQFKPFSSLKSTLRPYYCQITTIPPPALQHHHFFHPQTHSLSISIIFLVFLFSLSSFNGSRHCMRVLYSSSSPSEVYVCIFEAHFHLHLCSIWSQFLSRYLHDHLQHFPGLFTPVHSSG